MPRRLTSVALVAGLAGCWIVACATSPRGERPRYPPRRPNCALTIFHGDRPEVPAWDDLGLVEVICHIDDPVATCFARMRAEACRMGGDIVYHLPEKVWRPRDYAQGFRGKVAHTRRVGVGDGGHRGGGGGDPDAGLPPGFPPPASPEESAGPVVPLTGPGAPTAATPPAALPAPASSDAGVGQ